MDVVANDAGDRVTATVVAWAEDEVLVGSAARQWASRYPKSAVVYGNKSILGCGTNEAVRTVTVARYSERSAQF